MNPIDVIYNAVKKIRDRTIIKGELKVEGTKNLDEVFIVNKSFEMHTQKGYEKEGQESDAKYPYFKEYDRGGMNEIEQIITLAGMFSCTRFSKKEIGLLVISFNSFDFPDDIKDSIWKKVKQRYEQYENIDMSRQYHMYMGELLKMKDVEFTLKIFINKLNEIEKILLAISGEQIDGKNERKEMKLIGRLNFEW